jgi:hypothetical protein
MRPGRYVVLALAAALARSRPNALEAFFMSHPLTGERRAR